MMRKYITSILVGIVCSSVVHADDKEKTLYAAASTEGSRWQQTSEAMPLNDYERSVSNNQELVKQQIKTYSDRLLANAGAYGHAIGLLGATIAVVSTDKRYNLNDSKTMGMVFRDTASNERSVLLEYRKSW